MKDQAHRLRQIVENLKNTGPAETSELIPQIPKKHAKILTITSGKGGVGKTNFAVNLAISLSSYGFKVIILDADLGLSNIDVLFGIVPQYTLVDLINNKKNIFEIISDGPNNVRFISGGSGVEQLTKLDKNEIDRFINGISILDKIADFVIIDTGAGVSENVLSFIMAADEVVLVTNPEPTSITDAYALVKIIAKRDAKKEINLIVNRVENISEAEMVTAKLIKVAQRFLSVNIKPLGYLINDAHVTKSVKMQKPFSLAFPKAEVTKQIQEITRKLIKQNTDTKTEGMKGFVGRLVGFFQQ